METYLNEIEQEVDYLLEYYEKKGTFSDFVVLDAIDIILKDIQKIRDEWVYTHSSVSDSRKINSNSTTSGGVKMSRVADMARFSQQESGLPCIIWVNPDLGNNTGKHNMPRIKFQNDTAKSLHVDNMIPISIDRDNPKVLIKNPKISFNAETINKIQQWIRINYDVLIKYYRNEIFEGELFSNIKKV